VLGAPHFHTQHTPVAPRTGEEKKVERVQVWQHYYIQRYVLPVLWVFAPTGRLVTHRAAANELLRLGRSSELIDYALRHDVPINHTRSRLRVVARW